MDRPPARQQDPRSSNPLDKTAGIKLFQATLWEQSQGLQRTRWRYRTEVGPDASRPADLNRPENIRESSQKHQHNRFLKNAFEPISRVQSVNIQATLTSFKQGQICNHKHNSEQTKHNNTKQKTTNQQQRTSNPTESHTKSTTITESNCHRKKMRKEHRRTNTNPSNMANPNNRSNPANQ